MEDEESRLVNALKHLDVVMLFDEWKNPMTKSTSESRKAREEGNALYTQQGHDEKAHKEILRLYTRSIAYALPGTEDLGIAYGNRSALLVHLRRHRDALQDLNLALGLPLPDTNRAKYLCRKVECQTELDIIEAKNTCEEAKNALQELRVSDEIKKKAVIQLVKAIVKLEKNKCNALELKSNLEGHEPDKYFNERSNECPNASKALIISRSKRNFHFGRHLIADQNIVPGQVLFIGEPYVSFPMYSHLHTNCSHCLKFVWAGLPCDNCTCAIYCSNTCKEIAQNLYHDVECKIIHRCWKIYERMNSARLMSVRMLIMAMKESGSLENLRQTFEEINNCKDQRTKGFSNNYTMFINNYKSACSLLTHMKRRDTNELMAISKDSAVLLYFIARYTKMFKNYFDYDTKALIINEDALFVGKLLSHYQHLILINATTIKDIDNVFSTDWSWTAPEEETCTGLYLTPFLSLLNHSCDPNVARCETIDRKTILYSIQPISKGNQIFDCYGPTYMELLKNERVDLMKKFYFICDCIACKNNWPIFKNLMNDRITFASSLYPAFEALSKAYKKCDEILQSLKHGDGNIYLDNIQDLAYAIDLTIKFCKLPNWRLSSLITTLITLFNELYGYVINIPVKC